MATINVKGAIDALNTKALEVISSIEDLKARGVSDNTLKTQSYQRTREAKELRLIAAILEACGKDKLEVATGHVETLEAITREARQAPTQVTCQEGDSILELMERYANVPKLKEKLDKAVAKIGCRLDYKSGLVVKA